MDTNSPGLFRRRVDRYWRLAKDCLLGRKNFFRVVRELFQRRYVRWHVWRRPGEPIRIVTPTGSDLLLDPAGSFLEVYLQGLAGYEPDVQAALKIFLRPGSAFVDCGANAGFYSVMAQDIMGGKGTVIAIEANPQLIPLLNRNLSANGIAGAVNAAVTSRPGPLKLVSPRAHDALASIRPNALYDEFEVETFQVAGRTLDDILGNLLADRLDLMKIDIEGGELDAIKSGREIIGRFRPCIIAEYSRITWPEFGATHGELLKLCEEWRYAVRTYDVDSRKFAEVTPSFWESGYSNLFLLPEEKM